MHARTTHADPTTLAAASGIASSTMVRQPQPSCISDDPRALSSPDRSGPSHRSQYIRSRVPEPRSPCFGGDRGCARQAADCVPLARGPFVRLRCAPLLAMARAACASQWTVHPPERCAHQRVASMAFGLRRCELLLRAAAHNLAHCVHSPRMRHRHRQGQLHGCPPRHRHSRHARSH